jgi:hypothetical protein
MDLFRGDNTEKNKLLINCYTEGIFSRLINCGDPLYIKYHNLVKALKNHIKPEADQKPYFYDHSHFISFTSVEQIALDYMNKEYEHLKSKNPKMVQYLISLNIDNRMKTNIPGIYYLRYKCINSKNCIVCSDQNHHLILIDVVSLSKSNSLIEKNVIEQSQRDKEWLILPVDPMKDGIGYSSRIYPSDILKFKKKSV